MHLSMEIRARSVGVIGRVAALVILYAFLVKTVLVLAAPLAPAGMLAGRGDTAFAGAMLCLPAAVDQQARGDGQGPEAPMHDSSCCLLHCQLQLAILAPLVLAVLGIRLGPARRIWRPADYRGDLRAAALWRFQARGPPLAAF